MFFSQYKMTYVKFMIQYAVLQRPTMRYIMPVCVFLASCSFKIGGMLPQRHAVIGRDRCAARGNVGRRASGAPFEPEKRGDRRPIGMRVVDGHSRGLRFNDRRRRKKPMPCGVNTTLRSQLRKP
jgi:hypothetical protein